MLFSWGILYIVLLLLVKSAGSFSMQSDTMSAVRTARIMVQSATADFAVLVEFLTLTAAAQAVSYSYFSH